MLTDPFPHLLLGSWSSDGHLNNVNYPAVSYLVEGTFVAIDPDKRLANCIFDK
jgi:hypothetical protein